MCAAFSTPNWSISLPFSRKAIFSLFLGKSCFLRPQYVVCCPFFGIQHHELTNYFVAAEVGSFTHWTEASTRQSFDQHQNRYHPCHCHRISSFTHESVVSSASNRISPLLIEESAYFRQCHPNFIAPTQRIIVIEPYPKMHQTRFRKIFWVRKSPPLNKNDMSSGWRRSFWTLKTQ